MVNFIVDKSKSDYDEKNHIVLKMGKMIQVKDGKDIPMTSEVLMPDWSKIYPDGTIEKQNGTKTKMKEGERFNMEGEVMSKLNTGYTGPMVASTNKNCYDYYNRYHDTPCQYPNINYYERGQIVDPNGGKGNSDEQGKNP